MMYAFSCAACQMECIGLSGKCPVCKPHHIRAKIAFSLCRSNRCGSYGTDHSGRTGCLQLSIPCRLFDRLLADPTCSVGLFPDLFQIERPE